MLAVKQNKRFHAKCEYYTIFNAHLSEIKGMSGLGFSIKACHSLRACHG